MNLGFNVVICPPCGEKVGLPTKRGAHKVSLIWPLLPRLKAVLPPQGREMFRGFTQGRHAELVSASSCSIKGFTLIELLVVVLIIGILAAVAVPQYQKAVVKSRVHSILPVLTALREAEEVYYLANGQYTSDYKELDVDVPCSVLLRDESLAVCGNDWVIDLLVDDTSAGALVNANYCPGKAISLPGPCVGGDTSVRTLWLHLFFANSSDPNRYRCVANTEFMRDVCKSLNL